MQAKQGTPVADRDLNIKTVQVLTTPSIVRPECYKYAYDVNQCKSVDDYERARTVKPLVVTSATAQDCDTVMKAETQLVDNQSVEAVDFSDVHVARRQCTGAVIHEDLDLICNIADAYDLGGDSDTFSFISNCLYNTGSKAKHKSNQGSTLSLQRRKRFSKTSFSQSSMLGSDQLYPDSAASKKPLHQSKGNRKYKRRQSVNTDSTTTANLSNVYVNDDGNPIIL